MGTAVITLAAALVLTDAAPARSERIATETIASQSGLPGAAQVQIDDPLRSLTRASGWLNSQSLTAADLHGKVVVIDFWTYSCINWRRTLPYVRAWAERYKQQGLVVIGVHSPEFVFEKNLENIRDAVTEMHIAYPVAVDSDHAIWRAFKNDAWPALYFIDAQGRLRHRYLGEGSYEQSEVVIKQLLSETGATGIDKTLISADARGAEADADWKNLKSPETYLGYARTENFESAGDPEVDRPRLYSDPATLPLNHWALAGNWTVGREAILLNKSNGRIKCRFHARDVHLVMGPASLKSPVRFRVLIDGHPPGASHGVDVDDQGNGTITKPRMYQLIRQTQPIGDRAFEIEFLDTGVQAYSFTFG